MIDSRVRGKFPDLEVRLKFVSGITIEGGVMPWRN